MPLLGALFSGTSRVKERSELLIILTPHVVRSIDESDSVADAQIERVNRIRQLKRNEIEDYLKKYLDELLSQKSYRGELEGKGAETKPASQTQPGPEPLPPLGPEKTPSDREPPGTVIPMPAMPPPRPDRQQAAADAGSLERAQERFLAVIAADAAQPGPGK